MEHWTLEPLRFEYRHQGSYALLVAYGSVSIKYKGETFTVEVQHPCFPTDESRHSTLLDLLNTLHRVATTGVHKPPFSIEEYLNAMLSHPTEGHEALRYLLLTDAKRMRPPHKAFWERLTARLDHLLDRISTFVLDFF